MTIGAKNNFEVLFSDTADSLGLIKISVFDKNIVVSIENRDPIISTYRPDELERTLKSLERKLISNSIDPISSQKLIIFITQELLKKAECDQQSLLSNGVAIKDTQRIIDEIKKDKSTVGEISLENWEKTCKEKYRQLRKTVHNHIPSIWLPLEFILSVKSILNIADVTLPFAGIILGAPSTHKTVGLTMMQIWPQTFYTDSFTSKSLVSHSTAVTKEQLADIDMLPRWKNKLVLLPELAPIFTAKDEDLTQLLGILTSVLDGHGYESDSGAHGHRGYREKIMFAVVGASVDIPYKVHKVLGYLGPKLYFLRLPKNCKTEEERLKESREDFGQKEWAIKQALFEYLKWLEIRPDMCIDAGSGLPKIQWDSPKDDEDAERYIIRLSKLLSHLRGVAVTWQTKDTQGSDYAYTKPIIEEPSRAITQLKNLARGNAVSSGRNYLMKEDISIVVKTVLSTASVERVSIFDELLKNEGILTASQIAKSLKISPPTARRTMTELDVLGIVNIVEPDGNLYTEKRIVLKAEFNWFLTPEFNKLREAFIPTDNTNELDDQKRSDKQYN